MQERFIRSYSPDEFEAEKHFYPRALNAVLHPLARYFMSLSNNRIAERYHHLHPEIKKPAIYEILNYQSTYFYWGGADLIMTANETGERKLALIETNSCASGQKSMPQGNLEQEGAGYRQIIEHAFLPRLKGRRVSTGGLAVLFDKNEMEASGYAAYLAELCNEPVHLVGYCNQENDPRVRVTDEGWVEIQNEQNEWITIRAAFRYMTQKPWNRLPPLTKTLVFNPILTCLAGGRNKLLAAKAYDFFNAEYLDTGLNIYTPETIVDVGKEAIPLWVQKMGGLAVIKVPYANAGIGVYTITSPEELDDFMQTEFDYDKFIVQALIGNSKWSSRGTSGRMFHVGTVPDRRCQIFVSDLRMMVANGPNGFFPVATYARRAAKPLPTDAPKESSWDVLGTNLSKFDPKSRSWSSDTERLLMVDNKDFNRLGIGIDDLIQAYMQTAMSVVAIDKMAKGLVNKKGQFRKKLFRTINPDDSLTKELME